MQAVLGGQRAGDQRKTREQAGIKELREAGNTVRHLDAVDTVLHVGVIVADVKVARTGGVLAHAGKLIDEIADRDVAALRYVFDIFLGQGGVRGSRGGYEQILSFGIQRGCRAGDLLCRSLCRSLRRGRSGSASRRSRARLSLGRVSAARSSALPSSWAPLWERSR